MTLLHIGREPGIKIGISGWSKSDILVPGSTNRVQIQVQFPRAGYYTLQFAVDYPPGAFSEAGDVRVRADIIWTVAGNPIFRQIDIVNGTVISGMGESVVAEVYDNGSAAALDAYAIRMSVADGTRPGTPNPPMLVVDNRAVAIAPGAAASFQVPLNVGANSVFISVAPETFDVSWTFDALYQFVRVRMQRYLDYSQCNKWIPLDPENALISVRNGVGAPSDILAIPIYGIDG